jgi:hypothetical protein
MHHFRSPWTSVENETLCTVAAITRQRLSALIAMSATGTKLQVEPKQMTAASGVKPDVGACHCFAAVARRIRGSFLAQKTMPGATARQPRAGPVATPIKKEPCLDSLP